MKPQYAHIRAVQHKYGLTDRQMCTVLGGLSPKTYNNMRYRDTSSVGQALAFLVAHMDAEGHFLPLCRRMLNDNTIGSEPCRT